MRLLIMMLFAVLLSGEAFASVEEEARGGMEQILDFWHDGRFDAVYDRTIQSGNMTKETFVRTLSAGRRPACCWEKLQDVSVSLKTANKVALQGRFGFQDGPETASVTRKVTMTREDGIWKMSMTDAVAMAGGKQKGRHMKRKAKKEVHF